MKPKPAMTPDAEPEPLPHTVAIPNGLDERSQVLPTAYLGRPVDLSLRCDETDTTIHVGFGWRLIEVQKRLVGDFYVGMARGPQGVAAIGESPLHALQRLVEGFPRVFAQARKGEE